MVNKEPKLYCGFCSKSEDEVEKFFSGKQAYICDRCIEVAFKTTPEDNIKKLIKHHLLKKE